MLVLSRWKGQTLMIGDDVTITLLSIKENQISFGIQASRDVAVHREEVYQKIKQEEVVDKNQFYLLGSMLHTLTQYC